MKESDYITVPVDKLPGYIRITLASRVQAVKMKIQLYRNLTSEGKEKS